MQKADEILEFWFGEPPGLENSKKWWMKDEAFDREIESKFGALLQEAKASGLEGWYEEPRSALALVILIDQFSRNIYRGKPEAFEADARARGLCSAIREMGWDQDMHPIERWFLYMPLMHSEDLDDQKRSLECYENLRQLDVDSSLKAALESAYKFALEHYEIIERFGRFPHRNKILKRESSPEERAFLKTEGSSF